MLILNHSKSSANATKMDFCLHSDFRSVVFGTHRCVSVYKLCKHVRYLETIKNGKKMIKNVLNCFREAVKIVAWVVQSDTLRTTLIQEMYLISEVFDTFKNKKTTLHVIFKESLLWGALCSTVICSWCLAFFQMSMKLNGNFKGGQLNLNKSSF